MGVYDLNRRLTQFHLSLFFFLSLIMNFIITRWFDYELSFIIYFDLFFKNYYGLIIKK
jgi:hypothetical protein